MLPHCVVAAHAPASPDWECVRCRTGALGHMSMSSSVLRLLNDASTVLVVVLLVELRDVIDKQCPCLSTCLPLSVALHADVIATRVESMM